MKSVFGYIFLVFVIVALLGVTFSYSQSEEPQGKKIFVDSKCSMCHTVKSEGIESKKKDAVDLSTSGDSLKSEFLVKFLTKKEKMNGADHKIAFKGDDKNLEALAQWIESLKTK